MTYVCWQTGIPMSMMGLGQACTLDGACLSLMCRPDPADNVKKCVASCSNNNPCLPGYRCKNLPNCTDPSGCKVCLPE